MGRIYCAVIALLALTGAAVAGYLTYLHFYPAGYENFVICGPESAGNCDALIQGEYATLFGIPVAAYGLFAYLAVLFTALVAGYAGGLYRLYGLLIILPLVAVSLAADAVLAAVMIRLQIFCILCLATYLINVLLLAAGCLWYRRLKRQDGVTLRDALRALRAAGAGRHGAKAAAALYVLFVTFLAFSVFAASAMLGIRTDAARQPKDQTQQTYEAFYRQQAENLQLPPTTLTVGSADAKVKIVVFTDFLCAACYQFYQLEKELTAQYGDAVAFAYYNYPLDKECNPDLQRTMYASSCTAAGSMLAAASLGFFPEYMAEHFARYHEFHGQYGPDKAAATAAGLSDPARFMAVADSAAVRQILRRDIALADKLRIKATPTLFINGRRMVGVPSRELMAAIIERELRSDAR